MFRWVNVNHLLKVYCIIFVDYSFKLGMQSILGIRLDGNISCIIILECTAVCASKHWARIKQAVRPSFNGADLMLPISSQSQLHNTDVLTMHTNHYHLWRTGMYSVCMDLLGTMCAIDWILPSQCEYNMQYVSSSTVCVHSLLITSVCVSVWATPAC